MGDEFWGLLKFAEILAFSTEALTKP